MTANREVVDTARRRAQRLPDTAPLTPVGDSRIVNHQT
jgi:hypothetical protein